MNETHQGTLSAADVYAMCQGLVYNEQSFFDGVQLPDNSQVRILPVFSTNTAKWFWLAFYFMTDVLHVLGGECIGCFAKTGYRAAEIDVRSFISHFLICVLKFCAAADVWGHLVKLLTNILGGLYI